jgi:hypothetical protein
LSAVKKNDLNPDTLIRACYELGKAKKSKRCNSVTIVCGKGLEEVSAGTEGKTGDRLGEAMNSAGVDEVDLMRGLYLMANIKRFSGWGSVVYLWQNKRLVQVVQEQRYKVGS